MIVFVPSKRLLDHFKTLFRVAYSVRISYRLDLICGVQIVELFQYTSDLICIDAAIVLDVLEHFVKHPGVQVFELLRRDK